MQKIMIQAICLGILLVGIVMVPSVFAETHTVIIASGSDCAESIGGCFIPNVLTIQVGDTITWKNSDIIIIGAPHTSYKKIKIPKNKFVIDSWGLFEK